MRTNLIISTDIGTDIDDAVALYIAANSPNIDLHGVYVTNGPVVDRAYIAKHMLNLCGKDALVAVGESDAVYTQERHYTTGAEKASVPRKKHRLDILHGWMDAMAKQLERVPDMVVASIAPLTNFSVLLDKMPKAAKRIKTLYIMGGREGHNEHNFTHDTRAAQRVLTSKMNLVVVPADVCSRFECDIELLTGLDDSPAQRYLAHMAGLWKLYKDLGADGCLSSNSSFLRSFKERSHVPSAAKGREGMERELDEHKHFKLWLGMLCHGKNFCDEPNQHLHLYRMIRDWLKVNRNRLPYAKEWLDHMEANGMKSTRVSDAFVIYAIEHPEKIEEKRVTLSCDKRGNMAVNEGDRHRLVTDVDYKHFAAYLKRRLEQKPQRKRIKPGPKPRMIQR